jgi:hypothetical protein
LDTCITLSSAEDHGFAHGNIQNKRQNPSETDMDNKEEKNPSAVFVSFFSYVACVDSTRCYPCPTGKPSWLILKHHLCQALVVGMSYHNPAFKLHFSTFIPLFVG